MKKLLVVCLALLVLVGCSKGVALNSTYLYSDEAEGLKMDEKVTLKGTQDKNADWLDTYTSELTITFTTDEASETYLADLEADSEAYRTCPGDDGTGACSKYIKYEYSVNGNVFTSKEVIDYKSARKDKQGVTADDTYSEDEYYSFDETVNGLLEEGFTKQ